MKKYRNKETGEICTLVYISNGSHNFTFVMDGEIKNMPYTYETISEFVEHWEDYEEPLPFFTKSIRDAIRAWWKLQENPFKSASVLCINDRKDKDGFYNYHIYGYIREGENKIATEFQFRTKCYYEYEHGKDYTLEELCGGEE